MSTLVLRYGSTDGGGGYCVRSTEWPAMESARGGSGGAMSPEGSRCAGAFDGHCALWKKKEVNERGLAAARVDDHRGRRTERAAQSRQMYARLGDRHAARMLPAMESELWNTTHEME